MASSSSITPFSMKQYDVFLSARVEETRHSFISHLYYVLLENKIRTFIDNIRLLRGDEISSGLLNAIELSRISVIIFSKDYASSRWCLNELVKIIECRENDNQIVIPVYYDIEPSHVRHQTGPFAEAFKNHEASFDGTSSVQKWRDALFEASNLPSYNLSEFRSEAALTQVIVDDILRIRERLYAVHILNQYRVHKDEEVLHNDIVNIIKQYSGHKDEDEDSGDEDEDEIHDDIANIIKRYSGHKDEDEDSGNEDEEALHDDIVNIIKRHSDKETLYDDIVDIIKLYCSHKDEEAFYVDIGIIINQFSEHKDIDKLRYDIENIKKRYSGHKDEEEDSGDEDKEAIHDEKEQDKRGEDKEPKPSGSNIGEPEAIHDPKITADWIFVTTNLILELPSAVFDKLSSVHKPQYALVSMLLSFTTMLICIIQLAYNGGKARVGWRWRPKKIPWFYYPSPSDKPFGTVIDFIGLLCAIFQSIFTAIDYALYLRNINHPIKISIWPLIFSFCLMCSTFYKDSPKNVFSFCLMCSTFFKESLKKYVFTESTVLADDIV